MATKVNYYVKVINSSKKGLKGYSEPSYSSTQKTVYSNGNQFYVDRMATDTSGIWYRHMGDKTWVMFKTSSGKSYLKVTKKGATSTELSKWYETYTAKTSNRSNSDQSYAAEISKKTTTLGSLMDIGQIKSQTEKMTSTAETISSSASNLTKSGTSNGALVLKPGNIDDPYPIKTDVKQQNSNNYPPVDHTDNETGDIWYNWTIALNSLKNDILKIKKNLNAPSAYNRLQLAKLTNTKFNRYKIEYGDYRLKPTIGYVVFTRPDLNLFDEDKKLLPQIANDPQLYYIWRNNPTTMKQLTLDWANGHKFIPLLTNQVTALDVLDETVDTMETGETFSGFKMQYAKNSIRSLTSGSISVKFPETADLAITHMFQTWCSYESGVYRGSLIPKDDYCMYKILDYACNIYYFLMDTDMTIKFWSVYYGAFPTNVNKSIFSFDLGSDSGMSDVNVSFAYFHKLDMDTRSLVDFNNISGGVTTGLAYKLNTSKDICLGGGGDTWSGAPFIEAVKTSNGITTVDEFKLRFRT